MLGDIESIVERIKKESNNLKDIIYRKKIIKDKTIYIIFNEPLTSSDKISDFVIRSLNVIANNIAKKESVFEKIENDINNFKVSTFTKYKDLCNFLHSGFTIILVSGEVSGLALETKVCLARSIAIPDSESTIRGAKDSFVEDYQMNIGLVKKRIKTNDLWIKELSIGKYTQTKVGILSINGVVKPELVEKVVSKLEKIEIDGIVTCEVLKNLTQDENKSAFPTTISTERPDIVSKSLLEGKVAVIADNSPYALVIPGLLSDYFKTAEDVYSKSLNASFTRIIKHLAFWISILTPGLYIALTTYNQEMVPTELLVNVATQREGVPFPAFFEALMMIIAFEILRESDLRVPKSTGSALSIVGALVLGEAAVNAGVVSPIMIIVMAITSIGALIFTEPDFIDAIRWYRIVFMVSAGLLGIVGIYVTLIYFVAKLARLESYGKPYLIPYAPLYISGIKDGIIRTTIKKQTKRNKYLSDNTTKLRIDNDEDI